METRVVKDKMTKGELKALAHEQYGDLIKAAVDVEQEILGIGGELHVDIQSLLIEKENSQGHHTWGINLHIDKSGNDFVEFDSMINLKPLVGNNTRSVENIDTQNKIREIVNRLIQ